MSHRWRQRSAGLSAALVLLGLAGCAGQNTAADPAVGGTAALASPPGAALAYEHEVRVELDGARIAGRLEALTEACQSSRFGECVVLQVGQEGGELPSASLQVRIAPKGVTPFIALAGEAGHLASRNAHAEDLAQQVADTGMTRARLGKEHEKLVEYQQRPKLAVADLLAVSQRLAEIEAGLEQADREAAQQRRRIDTQRVTVLLQTPAGQSGRNEISEALRGFGGVFTESVAFVIKAVAALLPVVAVGGLITGLLLLWRRRSRARNRIP